MARYIKFKVLIAMGAFLLIFLTAIQVISRDKYASGITNINGGKRIEIRKIYHFPSPEQTNDGISLYGARSISGDRKKNIYIADDKAHAILVFDSNGALKKKIGRFGQGPGEFNVPSQTYVDGNGRLYIQEAMNMRFQIFDDSGNPQQIQHLHLVFNSFVVGTAGEIAGNPVPMSSQKEDWRSVWVFNAKGKMLRKFGEALSINKEIHPYNDGFLALNDQGELFYAAQFLAVVRKFNWEGSLLAEYHLAPLSESMRKAENRNRRPIENTYYPVIDRIRCVGESLYIFYGANAEILEFDFSAHLKNTYHLVHRGMANAIYTDFLVQENEGIKTFYLLMSYPSHRVDVCVPNM